MAVVTDPDVVYVKDGDTVLVYSPNWTNLIPWFNQAEFSKK